MTFLKPVIYTDYALQKITEVIYGNSVPFSFTEVRLSSEPGTLATSTTALQNTVYTMEIKNITITENKVSIQCEIPSTIAGVTIKEVGIFESNTLFAYGEISTTKPITDYELTIEMYLNLLTINIQSGYPKLSVTDFEYLTQDTLNGYKEYLQYITDNVEGCIDHNSTIIGYNQSQVFFNKLVNDYVLSYDNFYNTYLYSILMQKIGTYVTDYYSFSSSNYYYYKAINIANNYGFIGIRNNLFNSSNDTWLFNSSNGCSFSLTATLGSLENNTIINKADYLKNEMYFEFQIQNSQLVFTLYSAYGYHSTYFAIPQSYRQIFLNLPSNFVITYNGSVTNPIMKMYINGELVPTSFIDSNFNSISPYNNIPLKNYRIYVEGTPVYNEAQTIYHMAFYNKVLTLPEVQAINRVTRLPSRIYN